MLFWGNLNDAYRKIAKGDEANPTWISYQERGWESPHIVGYMEIHDEERIMFDVLQNGRSTSTYTTRDLKTALDHSSLLRLSFYLFRGRS